MMFVGLGRGTYILKDGEVVECLDIGEWAQFIEDPKNKRVARTDVYDCRVSTVFLGIDHGHGEGPPLLFETMVFQDRVETIKGPSGQNFNYHPALEDYTERYTTLKEAQKGHAKIVNKLKSKLRVVK